MIGAPFNGDSFRWLCWCVADDEGFGDQGAADGDGLQLGVSSAGDSFLLLGADGDGGSPEADKEGNGPG